MKILSLCLIFIVSIIISCLALSYVLLKLYTDPKIIVKINIGIITIGYITILIGILFHNFTILDRW